MTAYLTHSRLRTLRECQMKERLMYVEGWRPKVAEENLRFGGLVHLGLKAWWTVFWETKHFPGMDAFHAAIVAMEKGAADDYDRARAQEILRGYHNRWASEMSGLRILAVEQRFGYPLMNPDSSGVSRTFTIAGKIDAAAERIADSRKLVVEHKTTSEDIDDGAPYWQRLVMDSQLSVYVLGGESLGIEVDECLYDVIRKPGLRPFKATPEEKRQYVKGTGRLYANQHDHDETPEEFRDRLREEIAVNRDRYFARKPVPRMNSQIDEFLHDVWHIGTQLRENLERRAPKNPDSCFKFGSRCPFWDHCANGLDLSTSPDFQRLSDPYPELAEEGSPDAAAT